MAGELADVKTHDCARKRKQFKEAETAARWSQHAACEAHPTQGRRSPRVRVDGPGWATGTPPTTRQLPQSTPAQCAQASNKSCGHWQDLHSRAGHHEHRGIVRKLCRPSLHHACAAAAGGCIGGDLGRRRKSANNALPHDRHCGYHWRAPRMSRRAGARGRFPLRRRCYCLARSAGFVLSSGSCPYLQAVTCGTADTRRW